MPLLAHIGNIPVEEWLPFLAPVIGLYLYGRHKERRRRESVKRLLDSGRTPDEGAVRTVLATWAASEHREVAAEHLPLLYPPGPDGATSSELAARIDREPQDVERMLEDLAELGYVELDTGDGKHETRAWLTTSGCDLVNITEDTLLAATPPR